MRRSLSLAVLAGLGLATWGATETFAQASARPLRQPGTKSYALQYGLRVTQVWPGSTAAVQGIEPGDVVVSVNGSPVRSIQDLNHWIGQSGQVATMEVIDVRSGRWNQVAVYPDAGRIGVTGVPAPVDPTGRLLPPLNPWSWGAQQLPQPWYPPLDPWSWGAHPLPLPQPWPPPQGRWNGGVRPIPLPLPVHPGSNGMRPLPLPIPSSRAVPPPGR